MVNNLTVFAFFYSAVHVHVHTHTPFCGHLYYDDPTVVARDLGLITQQK